MNEVPIEKKDLPPRAADPETKEDRQANLKAREALSAPSPIPLAQRTTVLRVMGKGGPTWEPTARQKKIARIARDSIAGLKEPAVKRLLEVWQREPAFLAWFEGEVEGAFRARAREVWDRLYNQALTGEGMVAIRAAELYLERFDPPKRNNAAKGSMALFFEIEREKLRAIADLPPAS